MLSTVKNVRLIKLPRFSGYCFNRARDEYLRLARLRELAGLLRRAFFEYQIRWRHRFDDISLPPDCVAAATRSVSSLTGVIDRYRMLHYSLLKSSSSESAD